MSTCCTFINWIPCCKTTILQFQRMITTINFSTVILWQRIAKFFSDVHPCTLFWNILQKYKIFSQVQKHLNSCTLIWRWIRVSQLPPLCKTEFFLNNLILANKLSNVLTRCSIVTLKKTRASSWNVGKFITKKQVNKDLPHTHLSLLYCSL